MGDCSYPPRRAPEGRADPGQRGGAGWEGCAWEPLCRAVFALWLLCLYRSLNLASESSELLTRGCSARRLQRCTCPPACLQAPLTARQRCIQARAPCPPPCPPTRIFSCKNLQSVILTKTPRYALISRGCLPCTKQFREHLPSSGGEGIDAK